MKKIARQTGWSRAVYLLKAPSPIHTPVQSQYRIEFPCAARQPVTRAAVQNKTSKQSTVRTEAPTANKGVAAVTTISQNPARKCPCRARKRNSIQETMAALTGEKK